MNADEIIAKTRQSSGEAFQRFVDNWWQDTAQLAKENSMSERPKPQFPPEDRVETPAEQCLRFFVNGLNCGAWDKINGKPRYDVSGCVPIYGIGYNAGYDHSKEDPAIYARKQQVELTRRYLADYPAPKDITFRGVSVDNFSFVELKKILDHVMRDCRSSLN